MQGNGPGSSRYGPGVTFRFRRVVHSGDMREKVRVQRGTETLTANGGPRVTWADVAPADGSSPVRSCQVDHGSSGEQMVGMGSVTQTAKVFTLRWGLNILPQHYRFIYRGVIYYVTGVDNETMRNQFQIVSATSQANAPSENIPDLPGLPGTGVVTGLSEAQPVGGGGYGPALGG